MSNYYTGSIKIELKYIYKHVNITVLWCMQNFKYEWFWMNCTSTSTRKSTKMCMCGNNNNIILQKWMIKIKGWVNYWQTIKN